MENFFDGIIMLRFGETKVAKEKFYGGKKLMKSYVVNADSKANSKLVETKTNSNYLIGYLDKVIIALVLILSKMSGYIKTFKVKDVDKNKNNKLMSFHIDFEKLLRKYKTMWSKIKDFKNIELNVLPDFDNRYIKAKLITYGDKFYATFVA